MGMTQRDVVGREVGGGSCLGTHVRIKDFKINKNKNERVESLTNGSPEKSQKHFSFYTFSLCVQIHIVMHVYSL